MKNINYFIINSSKIFILRNFPQHLANFKNCAMVSVENGGKMVKVTIKELARISGVSPSTVSRALNDDPAISEETKRKVMQVARELNYTPVRSRKKSSTRKRSRIIALMVTDISNPFFPEIVHGVEDLAFDFGYSVSLWNTREDIEREKQYVETLKVSEVDGIILGSSRIKEEQIREIAEGDIPCVIINRIIENVPSIFADYENGAYQATKYLVNLGHERIALINGPNSAQPSLWREKGFLRALKESEIEVDESLLSFNSPVVEGGYVATLKLLSIDNPPTAIFAYNDLVALGAMKAIREKNLLVSKDISVVGYDDIFLSAYLDPPLTTVSQPKYMMGKLAADLLFRLINGEKVKNSQISLKPELIIRSSCGVRV